jgi:hypothetical protein
MLEARWAKGVLTITSLAADPASAAIEIVGADGSRVPFVKAFPAGAAHIKIAMERPHSVFLSSIAAKSVPVRTLKPIDDTYSHPPFPYDPQAFDKLRPDQVPRFLGALTDPDRLEHRRIRLNDLVAMQNRVDRGKVESARTREGGRPPVVVRMDGRYYIADGHHRMAAAYLNGDQDHECLFLDLTPVNNAMKGRSHA